jgi:hypothetical protein
MRELLGYKPLAIDDKKLRVDYWVRGGSRLLFFSLRVSIALHAGRLRTFEKGRVEHICPVSRI